MRLLQKLSPRNLFIIVLLFACLAIATLVIVLADNIPGQGEIGYHTVDGYLARNGKFAQSLIVYYKQHGYVQNGQFELDDNYAFEKLPKNTPMKVLNTFEDFYEDEKIYYVQVVETEMRGCVSAKLISKSKVK